MSLRAMAIPAAQDTGPLATDGCGELLFPTVASDRKIDNAHDLSAPGNVAGRHMAGCACQPRFLGVCDRAFRSRVLSDTDTWITTLATK